MDNGHTVHPGIWEIVWSETIIIFFFKENYGFYFFLLNLLGYLKVLIEFCLWEFGKDIMLTCAVGN